MARTFIKYGEEKGFEINEAFVQLAIYYIYIEAKKSQYVFSNKPELIEDFKEKINGIQNGWMVLRWYDDVITTYNEECTMLKILRNVKIILQSKGEYISIAELQAIPTEDDNFRILYSRNQFLTVELIKITDAIMKILAGTWNSNNYSMDINYQY